MILDAHLELSDSQGAITASAATTNVMNMGAAVTGADDTPMGFMVVDIEVTGTGTGTVIMSVQDCATVGGTYVDIASAQIAVATTLVAGDKIQVPIPGNHKQYLAGYFTIAGTVGALIVSAHIAVN